MTGGKAIDKDTAKNPWTITILQCKIELLKYNFTHLLISRVYYFRTNVFPNFFFFLVSTLQSQSVWLYLKVKASWEFLDAL